MGGKVCLRLEGKTLLGVANKLFCFQKFVGIAQQCFALLPQVKFTFLPIIQIFTEGEGDGIESRKSYQIFSTLSYHRQNNQEDKLYCRSSLLCPKQKSHEK
jgi:hypothetical protein